MVCVCLLRKQSDLDDVPQSLDEGLNSPVLRRRFREHLVKELCAENLAFYEAVESYQRNPKSYRARSIYKSFVPDMAPNQVGDKLHTRKLILTILHHMPLA